MVSGFDAIGIVAADMGTTLAFYRRLGLDIPPEADAEGHVEVELRGGVRLMWDTVASLKSLGFDWTAPAGSARMSLAWRCDSPGEVDRVYADLTGAGFDAAHQPWDAVWGQRYAVVLDPDGNPVDLYAPNS